MTDSVPDDPNEKALEFPRHSTVTVGEAVTIYCKRIGASRDVALIVIQNAIRRGEVKCWEGHFAPGDDFCLGTQGPDEVDLNDLAKFLEKSDRLQKLSESAALAEPDKRDAKILDLRHQVGQKQSEAAIERHASKRERTLAAVIETIATADRQNYISETSQKIIVAKLAQLVEDNRFKYGNILNLEGIEDIVGRILNGTYFA